VARRATGSSRHDVPLAGWMLVLGVAAQGFGGMHGADRPQALGEILAQLRTWVRRQAQDYSAVGRNRVFADRGVEVGASRRRTNVR
jgi:hypothetical protein